jgi:hypothetical protein
MLAKRSEVIFFESINSGKSSDIFRDAMKSAIVDHRIHVWLETLQLRESM